MPNIKLVVEYNGAKFHGWQRQAGLRTVQDELHKALQTVLREDIPDPVASGRTDAGVHARAQVINVHLKTDPDIKRLQRGVSSILRGELSILSAEIVPDEFHARFSAKGKHYRYTIMNRTVPAVLDRGRVWFVASPLDLPKMRQAAGELIGKHDFRCFQASGCSSKNPVKQITRSELTLAPPYIYYDVEADGFLKQMVRNIVGTLVAVGKGTHDFHDIAELLDGKDRQLAGPTAPAHGLCLEKVIY